MRHYIVKTCDETQTVNHWLRSFPVRTEIVRDWAETWEASNVLTNSG